MLFAAESEQAIYGLNERVDARARIMPGLAWETALALLAACDSLYGVTPSAVTVNACISALEKGGPRSISYLLPSVHYNL